MRRLVAALLCAAVLAPAPGCATGGVEALARRTERVAWFRAARTDGVHVWLSYEADVRDADGEPVGTRERAVELRLADLDPALAIPVDRFPLRWIAPGQIPAEGTRPLRLDVAREGGVDVGFRVPSLPGAPPRAHLFAGALTRRTTAGWAYAIYPLAVLWDAVAVPFLAVLGVPIFGWTE